MTDVIVRATALDWASDEFPGWLEVDVVDANGQAHRIVEKVPVLTTDELTIATPLPIEIWIVADVQHVDCGQVGITLRYGTETRGGLRSLTLIIRLTTCGGYEWPSRRGSGTPVGR
ncbi:hypothetical protein [Micromonospora tarapacensis]|uniref:hypothetical protein n=1 Tax=Micromonospora tarapacensis TaxID=2835305 RepID=UPI001E5ECCEF|nr:hypothetical protein [Micromonospora tarapacensis]